jgi:hypothetical protein
VEDVQAPEIVSLNEQALDVEELEARLEVASMVPNADCWNYFKCSCYYAGGCGVNVCP